MAASSENDDGIVGINVTPLVDIMLVLLLIFMVTSSYIVQDSIEVELPRAATGGESLETTLTFVLATDGALYLNGELTTREQAAERCAEAAAQGGEPQAVIAADKRVSHGDVISPIDLVRQNGVYRFALNIEPDSEGEKSK